MRKETIEFLNTRNSPEQIVSEYSQKYKAWKEKFANGDYTYPDKIFVCRGGMALGAAMSAGVASKLSEEGITFPLVVPSSAAAMTWGLIEMGHNPIEAQEIFTNFDMSQISQDSPSDIYRDKAFYSVRKLMRLYLGHATNGNKLEINRHISDGKISDTGLNLAFLTTQMPSREPDIYVEGKMITGIIASGAFPTAFSPIKDEKGNLLIDGDMSYRLPVEKIEDFLGFRPKEIIYARLEHKSKSSAIVRKAIAIGTNTPTILPIDGWADGIPVKELIVKPDSEIIKGIKSTDYHDKERMDYIFRTAEQATEEFFENF